MSLVIWNGLIQLKPETFVSSVFGNLLLRFVWAMAEVENKEQEKSQACGASPQLNPASSPRCPGWAAAGKHKLSGGARPRVATPKALASFRIKYLIPALVAEQSWVLIVPAKRGRQCGEIK